MHVFNLPYKNVHLRLADTAVLTYCCTAMYCHDRYCCTDILPYCHVLPLQPTFIAYQGNEKVETFTGANPPRLKDIIARHGSAEQAALPK